MTKPVVPKPWTPSKIEKFLTCPRQFQATYVTKEIKWVDNDYAKFGNLVHKEIEDYLKYAKPLHPMLAKLKPTLDRMKPSFEGAETKLAITSAGKAVDYWSGQAWQRCIVDAILLSPDGKTVLVVDWKTGKEKDAEIQSDMTAWCAKARYPEAETIITAFVFIFKGGTIKTEYKTAEFNIPRTVERIAMVDEACRSNYFPPRPSGLCRNYCDVFSCEHNGRSKP